MSSTISLDDLKSIRKKLKEENKKVVFTNGVFDLIHAGHVDYLSKAKASGDVLIVGLNTDESVKRIKGHNRPILMQDERAFILSNLKSVDYVILFEEDTPERLICEVLPDILVKGGDYTAEGVVGRELVESYGGRVELINFIDGKSTTSIINKILESYKD